MIGNMAKIILVIVCVHLSGVVSFASEALVIDSVRQYEYAKNRYDTGDFVSAVVEFKKFISFFPTDEKICDAKFLIGMAWYKGGKYGEAIIVFRDIIETETTGGKECKRTVSEAHFMLAKCHVASGNPVMAEITLDTFIKTSEDTREKDRALNTIGWIRLETAKWDKSREAFLSISPDNRDNYQVQALVKRLGETDTIKEKSPFIAGLSGIIPGGGYLYTHRYQDALVSFLLNGALIYAAVDSFNRENYALGGVISFVGFGFYSGSIYGSTAATHKYNRNERRKFINRTKKELASGVQIGLIPDSKRNSLALALRVQF